MNWKTKSRLIFCCVNCKAKDDYNIYPSSLINESFAILINKLV